MKKLAKPSRNKLAIKKRVGIVKYRPDFETLLDAVDNPLDGVEYPGDLQGDADVEMSAVLQSILERKKTDRERYRDLQDNDYYMVVCFQAARQKEQFQNTANWPVVEGRYIDGVLLAAQLGVEIDILELPPPARHVKRKFTGKEVLGNGATN